MDGAEKELCLEELRLSSSLPNPKSISSQFIAFSETLLPFEERSRRVLSVEDRLYRFRILTRPFPISVMKLPSCSFASRPKEYCVAVVRCCSSGLAKSPPSSCEEKEKCRAIRRFLAILMRRRMK